MDRRRFLETTLRGGAACSAALAGGALLGGCAALPYAPHTLEDGPSGRVVVQKANFGDGPFVMVNHPTLPYAIYLRRRASPASAEGETGSDYIAVLTRCAHQGCEVEPAGQRLVCPCHGSAYTTDGTVVQGPAARDLTRLPVSHDATRIYITP